LLIIRAMSSHSSSSSAAEAAEAERVRARRARFDRPTIRVAVLKPGSGPRAGERIVVLLRANPRTSGCVVTELCGADVRGGALKHHDVLYVPGGSVFAQHADLGTEGRAAVARWVAAGGGYVGVCAGALLASQQAFDGAVEGESIVGSNATWTGWDPSEGRWAAKVVLTPRGRAIVGGVSVAHAPARSSLPADVRPREQRVSAESAGHSGVDAGVAEHKGASFGTSEPLITPSDCSDQVQQGTARRADHEEVSVVLTGGCWYVPTTVHNKTLGIDIEPFEPLATFARIERQGSSGEQRAEAHTPESHVPQQRSSKKPRVSSTTDGQEEGGSCEERSVDAAVVPPETYGEAVPAVAGSFGLGRVVVWGPHPEATRSDEEARGWLSECVYWASLKGVREV
jgi:hypothetical protein